MDAGYILTIFWFFFACITFGCLVGGDTPKEFIKPTKGFVLKAWFISVFWPIAFLLVTIEYLAKKTSWLGGWR